ncbi:hypothetical protein [Enterovibrio norvegicus]|uniref:hypothetical protein n=1 Tax=Enterovibrio norvegicus TaxID=188144 RepID=UPI003D1613ED
MRLVATVSILNVIALIYGVTEGNWFAVYAGSLLYHYSQNLTIEDPYDLNVACSMASLPRKIKKRAFMPS